MYWLNLFRIAVILFCLGIPVASSSLAEGEFVQPAGGNPPEQYPAGSWNDSQPKADFDIREDIVRARAFLKDRTSGHTVTVEKATVLAKDGRGRTRKKVVRRRIIEPAFLLAVEDLKERRLSLVRFTNRGCETDGFDVVRTRNNGVGSRSEVRYPQNMAVLALRTTVHGEEKGYKEVVYTPYGPEIDTPQVREDGLNYLKGQIESARVDLEEKNVPLRGLGGISGDVTPVEISLVLSIIEHIDPHRFNNSPPGGETALVHEVLTIIGVNMSDAYAYSRSPAGARGLFQFIPGTYEKMQRKYSQARLERNFAAGCSNHVNAAKASLLLFDSDLNDLPSDYLRTISDDVQAVGRYLGCGVQLRFPSGREIRAELRRRVDLSSARGNQDISEEI